MKWQRKQQKKAERRKKVANNIEEPFVIYIDGVAYWVYPETDILAPYEYKYC